MAVPATAVSAPRLMPSLLVSGARAAAIDGDRDDAADDRIDAAGEVEDWDERGQPDDQSAEQDRFPLEIQAGPRRNRALAAESTLPPECAAGPRALPWLCRRPS